MGERDDLKMRLSDYDELLASAARLEKELADVTFKAQLVYFISPPHSCPLSCSLLLSPSLLFSLSLSLARALSASLSPIPSLFPSLSLSLTHSYTHTYTFFLVLPVLLFTFVILSLSWRWSFSLFHGDSRESRAE